MKKCTVCKKKLPYQNFHRSKMTKDGYGYRCRVCDKEARKGYRERNRERFAEVSRRKQLKFKYGITLEEYGELLEKQGGCCAVCQASENNTIGLRRKWNFSVDHCHDTGKVRGLLCNNCNRGIGFLGDTADGVRKALEYLEKSETH